METLVEHFTAKQIGEYSRASKKYCQTDEIQLVHARKNEQELGEALAGAASAGTLQISIVEEERKVHFTVRVVIHETFVTLRWPSHPELAGIFSVGLTKGLDDLLHT